jgi:hypothetical protein
MRLKVDLDGRPFDGRRLASRNIIDEDTGKEVGHIQSNGVGFAGHGGIYVSLFGGKYTITANRFDECWGFMKGVEAVLNHMTTTERATQNLDSTAA